MPAKRQIRQNLKRLESIKTWQLVVLLVLACFVAATFLRLNNTGMVERRNAVLAADEAGDESDILARLYDLQRYSAAHMNSETGVFYLQATYNRDVKQLMGISSNDDATGTNSPQARADAICNPHLGTSGYSKAYQDCIINELSKEGQIIDPASIKMPSTSLYRHSFISPLWSPDFAGWSVLLVLIIAMVILVRLLTLITLKILLKIRYRTI